MPFLSSLSYSSSVVVNVTIFRFMQCSLESACHDVWILKCLHLLVQTSGLSLISNISISNIFLEVLWYSAICLHITYNIFCYQANNEDFVRSLFSPENNIVNDQCSNTRCININITVNHNYLSNALHQEHQSSVHSVNSINPNFPGSSDSSNSSNSQSQCQSVDETSLNISTTSSTTASCGNSNSVSIASETEAKIQINSLCQHTFK